MSHRVEITEPAKRDADAIYDWLYGRSPDGALRWWQVFLTTLEELKHNPIGYATAPESNVFDEPVLQLQFKTRRGRRYRAFFIVRNNVVYVLRVRGGGQDLISHADIEMPK